MNTIIYGSKQKLLSQFYSDKSIIQQFSTQWNTFLDSIEIYLNISQNVNRDYNVKFIIIDSEQNLLFTKNVYMGDVFESGFYKIKTSLQLQMHKEYYLCIDSYQQGNNLNYVGFYIGYRKKMLNFFINNNFSIGQLYCKFNYLK